MSKTVLVMKQEDWEEYHWILHFDNEEQLKQLKEIRRLLAKPDTDWETISWLTDLGESLTNQDIK